MKENILTRPASKTMVQVTKRSFFIAYVNVLLVTAILTLAVVRLTSPVAEGGEKRQHYIDLLGLSCTPGSDKCGAYGDCLLLDETDPFGDHICVCHDGYTHFEGVCDYLLMPQFNAFMASFFGGSVGADWFYLFRGGSNGGYGVAGVFKLLTGGGFSIWWLVDWIRVLTKTFPDGNGMRLYENLTDTDL